MTSDVENLSSKLTFFYKFVVPPIWIGMFGYVMLVLFLAPDSHEIAALRWIFLGALISGSAFIYWACMRIKWVSLTEGGFVIANYRHTVRVPFRDVERVSSSILLNPQLIWLHLRRPTEFGKRIVFMPKQRFFGAYTRHPLAKRLNQLLATPEATA